MKNFTYSVDQKKYTIKVDGDTFYGSHEQLITKEKNLIKDSTFSDLGYIVIDFLPKKLLQDLKSEILNKINSVTKNVISKEYSLDSIQYYHKDVTDEQHKKVVSLIYNSNGSGVPTSHLNFDFSVIENRISEICNVSNIVCKMPDNIEKEFYIRIVRPTNKADANPPHRDVWIPRLKNAVNIHYVIAGNNSKSTLALLPGSHLWYEDEIERTLVGASTNGNTYQVPSVVNAKKPMNLIRPRLSDSDVLVFTPYMIHGGGPNISDVTRISLEMRFWKK
jgi:hypothetical protein